MKQIFDLLVSFKFLGAILGIGSIVFAALVQFFLPELTESVFYLLILGAALLLYFVSLSLRQIWEFLIGKRGRYGINSALMILVFLAIVLVANYLGVLKHRRFDLTASNQFTLAPQTINTVKNLKTPVEVLAFYPNLPQYRAEKLRARYLLEEYRFFNRNFDFRFIDPETKPAEARKYNIRRNGTLLFISEKRQKPVARINEQDFTGALLEVMGIKSKKVCFLAGHGERDLDDQGEKGYSVARMGLIRDLYQAKTLHLSQSTVVPDDCAVLVVAGANKSFPAKEREAIRDYLQRHGKLLLLTDPSPPVDVQTILSDWGLRITEGRVLDGGAYAVPDKQTPAVYRGNYPPMIITRDLDTTYFPEAAGIGLTADFARVLAAAQTGKEKRLDWPISPAQLEGLVVLPALLTTKISWLEDVGDATGDEAKATAEGKDKAEGPLALGVMMMATSTLTGEIGESSDRKKLTRIIAIGDADFASNAHIRNGGNGDLFLNSISWLAEEEHLIEIRPKQDSFRRLVVSENATRFIQFSTLGLLPMLFLMLGAVVWWRNR